MEARQPFTFQFDPDNVLHRFDSTEALSLQCSADHACLTQSCYNYASCFTEKLDINCYHQKCSFSSKCTKYFGGWALAGPAGTIPFPEFIRVV